MGGPLSYLHRQLILEQRPSLLRMAQAPPCHNEVAQSSHVNSLPSGYVYSDSPLHNAELFNLDAFTKDS
jgi:hypothetical protein